MRLVHQVRADHGSRSAKPRLAVDRHGVLRALDNVHEAKKLIDYLSKEDTKTTLRQAAVGEVQVVEPKAVPCEAGLVVGRAV